VQAPFIGLGVGFDPFAEDAAEGKPAVSSDTRLAFTFWMPVTLIFSPTISGATRISDTFAVGASLHPLITRVDLTLTIRPGGAPGAGPDFSPSGVVRIHRRPDGTAVSPPENFDAGTGQQVTWGEVFSLASASAPASGVPPPTSEIHLQELTGFGIAGSIGALWT